MKVLMEREPDPHVHMNYGQEDGFCDYQWTEKMLEVKFRSQIQMKEGYINTVCTNVTHRAQVMG